MIAVCKEPIVSVVSFQPWIKPPLPLRGKKVIIGRSVNNRKIKLYKFGNRRGPAILFLGAQHGSEWTTARFLRRFIAFLKKAPRAFPRQLQLWLIPILNPDGYASQRRFNANGVDLNRNFNTKNWKKHTWINTAKIRGGGGDKPFSEPETKALSRFLRKNKHRLLFVVNIHCRGNVVIADKKSPLTRSARDTLAEKSHLTRMKRWSSYPVTGSLHRWLKEKSIAPSVFIELSKSRKNRPFRGLKRSFLAMLREAHENYLKEKRKK